MKLGADVRRQVFLISKESVNNIVRHSARKEADIEFRAKREKLLRVGAHPVKTTEHREVFRVIICPGRASE
jgi:hypothetical protein